MIKILTKMRTKCQRPIVDIFKNYPLEVYISSKLKLQQSSRAPGALWKPQSPNTMNCNFAPWYVLFIYHKDQYFLWAGFCTIQRQEYAIPPPGLAPPPPHQKFGSIFPLLYLSNIIKWICLTLPTVFLATWLRYLLKTFRFLKFSVWVTRLERPKGAKDEVKRPEGPPPRSRGPEGP